MTNHRQIWKNYNGKIPLDEFGRPFDIHHINGNRKDNRIENLQCLSIRDHYELHLKQEDWADVYRIAKRLGIEIEERLDLYSISNRKRLANGTHPFQKDFVKERSKRKVMNRVSQGIHGLQKASNLEAALEAKRSKFTSVELSEHVKKGWENWKENHADFNRTLRGRRAAVAKTKGSKWFHKEDGSEMRTYIEDPIILLEGWLIGRFKKVKE